MPSHGFLRDVQGLRYFGMGKAAKVAELYDLSFHWVFQRQFVERLADQQQLLIIWFGGYFNVGRVEALQAAPVFGELFAPRGIDKNVAHRLGCGGKKVGAPRPIFPLGTSQAQIGFMDKGSGLERVAGGLTSHLAGGQIAQFLVNQREQFFRAFCIPAGCGVGQFRDRSHKTL